MAACWLAVQLVDCAAAGVELAAKTKTENTPARMVLRISMPNPSPGCVAACWPTRTGCAGSPLRSFFFLDRDLSDCGLRVVHHDSAGEAAQGSTGPRVSHGTVESPGAACPRLGR